MRFEPKAQVEELATDPVCGMTVSTGKSIETKYKGKSYYFCSPICQETFAREAEKYVAGEYIKGLKERVGSVFMYAFVDMPKRIGLELLLGLALAALVTTITPIGKFVGDYFSGGLGYLFSLGFGLVMYICATASVPLAAAFISQGMNIGAGMVLLIVGPITSLGTVLVVRKEFGNKTLLIYLVTVSIMALTSGYCFSII